MNGLDALAVTKLDVLSGMPVLKIATSYKVGGCDLLTEFPGRMDLLERAEPLYEELPGWEEDLSGARTWEDLPPPGPSVPPAHPGDRRRAHRLGVGRVGTGSDDPVRLREVWN